MNEHLFVSSNKASRVKAAFDGRELSTQQACEALQSEFGYGIRRCILMLGSLKREGIIISYINSQNHQLVYRAIQK
jgi:hypothetical protein